MSKAHDSAARPPKRWRRTGLILLGIVAGILGLGKLWPPRDIRPISVKAGITAESREKGHRLLAQLASRYGGLAEWRRRAVTQMEFSDDWPEPLKRKLLSPWKEGETLRLTCANGKDPIRLEFLSGARKGLIWGMEQGRTYTVRDGQQKLAPDKDIRFMLPTIQYFLEMPFRVGEADVVAHAGERELNGKTYDLVFLSWGRPEPQRQIDQYILWIRRPDTILEYAQYTVRELSPLITSCMHYDEQRDVDGILVPFRMHGGECPGGSSLMYHRSVRALRFLPGLPEK